MRFILTTFTNSFYRAVSRCNSRLTTDRVQSLSRTITTTKHSLVRSFNSVNQRSNLFSVQSSISDIRTITKISFNRLSSISSTNTSTSSASSKSTVPDTTMAPTAPIFTIQIPAYKSATHTAPEGNIVCTSPAPKVYLLTFTQPPDNRLTPPFLDAFNLALDVILSELPPGVVITTSGITKFYSNGLDYGAAISDPLFMHNHLYPLWRKLLTYPYPTIALVNGHNFAGGLMTAMAHDYRIMNPHRGFLCLNELDFNAPLTPPMASVFRVKLSMTSFRTLILEGKRFGALAALEAGIVDGVGGLEETLKVVGEMGLTGKVRDVGVGSYGLIKEEMYREVIEDLDAGSEEVKKAAGGKGRNREKRLEEGKKSVERWKKKGGELSAPSSPEEVKAKL